MIEECTKSRVDHGLKAGAWPAQDLFELARGFLLNLTGRRECDLPEVPPRMRMEASWSFEVYLLGREGDVILMER